MASCVSQIESGADEIYLGYRVDFFKRMSFSARPQIKNGGYLLVDKSQFAEIVHFANNNGTKVFLTANTPFFSDYPIGGLNIENEYLNYVQFGIECGIDGVIVSDIGLMYTLHKKGVKVPIVCSTLVDVDNLYQILFLKSLGVSRVVLSYQITMPELTYLCKHGGIEIEVFGYGGCSFSSNCMLGHGERFQIPCENSYSTNTSPKDVCKRICSALNCSLCSVWDLFHIGVSAIKIQGRERDYRKVIPLTRVFRTAIDLAARCETKEVFIKELTEEIPYWWKKVFCDMSQCKFEKHFSDISISSI